MRIFEDQYKINFVDDNNVLVGFDYYQCCCESFGWFISYEINGEHLFSDGDNVKANDELKDFEFDPTYHEIVADENDHCSDEVAVFKLVSGAKKVRYLHLYNRHNGFYSHGFSMYNGDTHLFGGSL